MQDNSHQERSLALNQKHVIMKVIRSDHVALFYNRASKASFHRPKAQEIER